MSACPPSAAAWACFSCCASVDSLLCNSSAVTLSSATSMPRSELLWDGARRPATCLAGVWRLVRYAGVWGGASRGLPGGMWCSEDADADLLDPSLNAASALDDRPQANNMLSDADDDHCQWVGVRCIVPVCRRGGQSVILTRGPVRQRNRKPEPSLELAWQGVAAYVWYEGLSASHQAHTRTGTPWLALEHLSLLLVVLTFITNIQQP